MCVVSAMMTTKEFLEQYIHSVGAPRGINIPLLPPLRVVLFT